MRDAERWLARKVYERGHFDRVIEGYREVQKPLRAFSPGGRATVERLISQVFPPATSLLPVHILDLEHDGFIERHVDHVGYSGTSIVGLSLLTDGVMTLHHEPRGYHEPRRAAEAGPPDEKDDGAPWLALRLPRRSLYVLRGPARYEWAHAVPLAPPPALEEEAPAASAGAGLGDDGRGGVAQRGRRLSIILRDERIEGAPRGEDAPAAAAGA